MYGACEFRQQFQGREEGAFAAGYAAMLNARAAAERDWRGRGSVEYEKLSDKSCENRLAKIASSPQPGEDNLERRASQANNQIERVRTRGPSWNREF